MYAVVLAEYENADAVIKAAAVADYRPAETAELRIFYANVSGTEHYLATHRTPLSDIDTLLSQLIERLQHITTA